MNIGFLGCGKIAEPMVRSLARRMPDCKIYVSHRSTEVSSRLCQELDNVIAADNQDILDYSEIIILSMLADVARSVCADLEFKTHHRVLNVMADINLEEISELISPAVNPSVTVPLPFIESGGCPLPVYPDAELVAFLFGDENTILALESESHIGPHFAATALLSTVMAQLDCVSKWLGHKTNNAQAGEIYMLALFSGYLNFLPKDGKQRFVAALRDLSTEGGLNAQLLKHNTSGGMLDRLESGMQQLDARLNG